MSGYFFYLRIKNFFISEKENRYWDDTRSWEGKAQVNAPAVHKVGRSIDVGSWYQT